MSRLSYVTWMLLGLSRIATLCQGYLSLTDTNVSRGCGLLARLATYHSDCFLASIFISVGYIEPGVVHDIGTYTQSALLPDYY